ncbi:MAG TPA: hypothetical protein VLG68_06085 [Gammaproteobacteria bacterium]|nr:hypothetical protein [Gammaproteobacteria bacterium]
MKRPSLAAPVVLLLLGYPFAVYLVADYVEPRTLMAVLLALLAVRVALTVRKAARYPWLGPALSLTLLTIAAAVLFSSGLKLSMVRVYPAIIDFCFFSVFFGSLFTSMPLVERIARAVDENLPPQAVRYTRRVTWAWSLVLLCNTLAALYTAFYASLGVWSLYNGLLSYLLIGATFAVEYALRTYLRRVWSRV